jgi:hypothetical protein
MSEIPGLHDFDFLFGHWSVRGRRLKEWLAGCEEWVEFDAELKTWPLLDGFANVDDYRANWGDGLVGAALRLLNPQTGEWSIYWIGKANPVMDTSPVVGRFDGGRGVFETPDEWNGQSILTRFIWSDVTRPEPHWEQAFSTDDGKTWETNWVMDYTRISHEVQISTR